MIPQSHLLQKGWSENPDLYTGYSIAYNKSIFFTNFCGLWYPCFELPVSCALGPKAWETFSLSEITLLYWLLKNINTLMIAIIFLYFPVPDVRKEEFDVQTRGLRQPCANQRQEPRNDQLLEAASIAATGNKTKPSVTTTTRSSTTTHN